MSSDDVGFIEVGAVYDAESPALTELRQVFERHGFETKVEIGALDGARVAYVKVRGHGNDHRRINAAWKEFMLMPTRRI